jgi:hypothetical protein
MHKKPNFSASEIKMILKKGKINVEKYCVLKKIPAKQVVVGMSC